MSRERGAILFLHLSFWEPLFSRSIHHNDRSPQNSLVFPFSSPLSFFLSFPYVSIFMHIAFHILIQTPRSCTVNEYTVYSASLLHRNCLLTINNYFKLAQCTQTMSSHIHTSSRLLPPRRQIPPLTRSSLHCHRQLI